MRPTIISYRPFQSTLPRRERHSNVITVCIHLSISIHAPAKGATCQGRRDFAERGHFNPRSREGSDSARAQQTAGQTNFNPRSREGSDDCQMERDKEEDISIHAPAKGATFPYRHRREHRPISIHAPAKGATAVIDAEVRKVKISIHAPAKGATSLFLRRQRQGEVFQSTLPRRERHLEALTASRRGGISIHAPAKGATLCSYPREVNA